jgi:hypothetical protein
VSVLELDIEAGRDFGEVRLDLSTLGILVSSASAI